MNSFRIALLASCIVLPALAQEVPAIDGTATSSAIAAAPNRASAAAASQGTFNATATAQATNTGGAATQAGAVPRTMPPPVSTVSPNRPLNPKEAAGIQVANRWINRFQKPHLDENGVLHFISGKGQVFVVAAVDHITDVALSPSETIFLPIHVGADGLWHVHTALSRAGGKPVWHLIIKPIDAGLSTNVLIETSKRTISISLSSRQAEYMPLVSLDAPEDEDADMAAYAAKLTGGDTASAQPLSACDTSPVVPPDQFRIDGDKASWKPTQVYQVSTPVGIKTCVDFPSDIGSTSLPALLALADDGGWFNSATKTVVNVRFINRRFIVDEALNRFVLVDGVGGDQHAIRIVRKGL